MCSCSTAATGKCTACLLAESPVPVSCKCGDWYNRCFKCMRLDGVCDEEIRRRRGVYLSHVLQGRITARTS